MNAHVIETTVPESGSINVAGLPFAPGTNVEIIVLERQSSLPATPQRRFPYRGMPYRYDDPFEPAVPIEDWDVYREDAQA